MRIANARRAGRRSTARVAVVALLIVALSGCASTPDPQLTPTPSATAAAPVFASDEEALAAATEAYAAYLTMSDQIAGDGGASPHRISPFVSAGLLDSELDGFASFREANAFLVGNTRFWVADVQKIDRTNPDRKSVV